MASQTIPLEPLADSTNIPSNHSITHDLTSGPLYIPHMGDSRTPLHMLSNSISPWPQPIHTHTPYLPSLENIHTPSYD